MILEDVLSTEYLGQDKPVNKIDPVVSVHVITYQHAPYIRKCLDSILMQDTDFPFEIIIGEDNSTDGTREICKEYADKHQDKIRLFLRRPDQKIEVYGKKTFHFNFIENLKAARGEYIALCEGDDYWLVKDKLQRQRDFMEGHPECRLVCHDMPSLGKYRSGWYDFKQLANTGYLPHASNYFMRPPDLNKYKQAFLEFLGAEMLVLYIAAKEGLVYHDKRVVSFYRLHEGGIYNSQSEVEKTRGELLQLDIINRHFKLPLIIYLNKKIGWTNKLHALTGERRLQVRLFKLYELGQKIQRFLRRRI